MTITQQFLDDCRAAKACPEGLDWVAANIGKPWTALHAHNPAWSEWAFNNLGAKCPPALAKQITTLYAGGSKITDEGLRHLPNLTTLSAGGSQITDKGLRHLPNLTNLHAGYSKITDAMKARLRARGVSVT